MSDFLYFLFKQRANAPFFAILALRRRIIYKVQKGRDALSTFERTLLFCCRRLWLALGQWFQSYNFPFPRLRFLIMLFCNVPFFFTVVADKLPFPLPFWASCVLWCFEPTATRLHSSSPKPTQEPWTLSDENYTFSYLSVYNPMASFSCPYLANLDSLAIPVASLVMLISFTCSYLPILIITRRACVIFVMYNVLNSPVILSWHRKQKYILQPTHDFIPPSLSKQLMISTSLKIIYYSWVYIPMNWWMCKESLSNTILWIFVVNVV